MSGDGEAVSVKWCLPEFRKLINGTTRMVELGGCFFSRRRPLTNRSL